MSISTKAVLICLVSLTRLASATCYWPTGNATYDRDATEHKPCSNDTTDPLSTICCALGRSNPSGGDISGGRTNDECLPSGICRNRVLNHGTMQVSYWRETCTSQDWKTGLCLDVCADDWSSGNGTTGAVMTPCDGTEKSLLWCCGTDTTCCSDSSKVKTIAYSFRGAIPNTASDSSIPLATSTSTSTSTPSVSSNSAQSSGLSTGAKAGIGIGAAIGGLALIGIGFFMARRHGQDRGKFSAVQQQGPLGYPPPDGKNYAAMHGYPMDQAHSPGLHGPGLHSPGQEYMAELPHEGRVELGTPKTYAATQGQADHVQSYGREPTAPLSPTGRAELH